MIWRLSHRFDPRAAALADRHYSRQSIGSPQFMPAGSCLVLYAQTRRGGCALWGTSWPLYAQHRWRGAWLCSIFRNEGAGLSSSLIRAAVAATRAHYGAPPKLGMVTFVDQHQVRAKADPGHCFLCAGFEPDGETEGGKLALRLAPERMPGPVAPIGLQFSLLAIASRETLPPKPDEPTTVKS